MLTEDEASWLTGAVSACINEPKRDELLRVIQRETVQDVRTSLRINVDCSFDNKYSTSYSELIVQNGGETDEEFLKRAAIIMEDLRRRSR